MKKYLALALCLVSFHLTAVQVMIPDIGYTAGRGLSYNGGYASVGAFLAAYDPNRGSYPFFDIQGHRIDNGTWASNVGVGYRHMCCDCVEMVGVNVYYDRREIEHVGLEQMGLGVELFGRCWDLRANGYWPIGNNEVILDTVRTDYNSEFFAISDEVNKGLWGFDIEIGRYLFCCDCFNIYGALGPYFYGSECCHSLVGGMGRLEARLWNCFSAEFIVLQDHVFGTNVQGRFTLNLPFPCCIRDCWQCLFPPVRRNRILVVEDLCCWTTNF